MCPGPRLSPKRANRAARRLKQERHKNDFAKHELEKEKRRFDELKSEAMQLVDQKERALLAERAEKEQARGANEELSREVSVLQAKWPAVS